MRSPITHPFHVGILSLFTALAPAPLLAQSGAANRDQTRFWELSQTTVIPTQTTVHTETINLSQAGIVYVQSDGTFGPSSWPTSARADMWITIDGVPVSNVAIIEWTRSVAPQIHSFNVIGSANLTAGSHTVRLMANTARGTFLLGAGTNLSVFPSPAQNVIMSQSQADSPDLAFTNRTGYTSARCTWTDIDYHAAVRIPLDNPELPVIAFASARVYRVLSAGDAMISIFEEQDRLSSEIRTNWQAIYSVDDLWLGAEYQGPVYSQGILTGQPTGEFEPTLVLGATEYPPSIHPNKPLNFRIGSEATLVAMYGGLQVAGSKGNTAARICDPICIGGSAAGCPPLGTEMVISSASFNVPPGHDGRVLFTSKARVQGHPQDGAVRIFMRIKIDGNHVGSLGTQGLAGWLGGWDATLSQRTLAASYLATGANALSPGNHTVEVACWAKSFTNPPRTTRISVWDDDPFLIWID